MVSASVAQRTGMIHARYRTADGRFIVDNKDLARVRLLSSEFVTGLQGVEQIDDTEAQRLIRLGGHRMGLQRDDVITSDVPAESLDETEEEQEAEEVAVNDVSSSEADEASDSEETSADEADSSISEENNNENIEEEASNGNND